MSKATRRKRWAQRAVTTVGSRRTLWVGFCLNLVRNEPLIVSLLRYRDAQDRYPAMTFAEANLISSETRNGTHMPIIDLDGSAKLVPSSTPGKNHLYLDVEMSWLRYAVLLTALKWAGVIETGFWAWSLRRRASFVRPPGVIKTPEESARAQNVHYGWLFHTKEAANG